MPTPADQTPTLYEALHGKPDPMSPHFEEALTSLGVVDSAIWRQALEAMAGTIRHASQRGRMPREKEGGGTEFVYQRGYTRAEMGKMLKKIARFTKSINDLTDPEEVRETLAILAPRSPRDIDDV